MKITQGSLTAQGAKFAIILSRFNEDIGSRLLGGCISCLKKYGSTDDSIDVYTVPGAFEIPVTAEKLAAQNKYSAIICLGAVIRGGTPHFDYVAGGAAEGIMQAGIKYKLPIIFGVLTTDNYDQAMERSVPVENINEKNNDKNSKELGTGNKGWDSALTAIEMANLFSGI